MTILERDKLSADDHVAPGLEALTSPAADMLEFRRKFVIRMGWVDKPYDNDNDRYDLNPSTIHFVNRHESGAVLSGMRLTPLASIDESLSVEMLKTNPDMYRKALDSKDVTTAETDVWDLTRLVNRFDDEPLYYESLLSMLEVFGAGLAKTQPTEDKDLIWLFTTTGEMKNHLDKAGIKADIVAQGKIQPDDKVDSFFCVIHPVEAMRFLHDHQDAYGFTYDQVYEGYQSVR